MKKKIKLITMWIAISLIAQIGVLFYVENYVFADTGENIKIKKVEEKKEEKIDINIDIPLTAENVNMSHDGKFLAYANEGSIYIINTVDGNIDTLECDGEAPYYKWLNDRNRMIIAEQHSGGNIELSSYDVPRKEKEEYKTISTGDSKAAVTDIEASTLTQVTYVKVSFSKTRHKIYRIGINNDLKAIPTKTTRIGAYKTLNRQDVIIYQDLVNRTIYSSNGKNLNVKGEEKSHIIGLDSEDNIYIGYENLEGKIASIRYGKIDTNPETWHKYEVIEPVDESHISVSKDGSLLVNDNLRGNITDLKTSAKAHYEGVFIGFYNKGVATIDEGKLVKIVIE